MYLYIILNLFGLCCDSGSAIECPANRWLHVIQFNSIPLTQMHSLEWSSVSVTSSTAPASATSPKKEKSKSPFSHFYYDFALNAIQHLCIFCCSQVILMCKSRAGLIACQC